MKTVDMRFDTVHSFDMSVAYAELIYSTHKNGIDSHVHSECEIYINLSGDVSIIVENHIYPVKRGDVIITRPFEYHHCVYHSSDVHKHYWILFSPRTNEALLDMFFNRKSGEGNLLILSPENSEALISLCDSMLKNSSNDYTNYSNFFKMLELLDTADRKDIKTTDSRDDVITAINYINNNFAYELSVSQIAMAANVSVNTLERHFMSSLNMSPSVYLRKKRLANAIKLLSSGASVTEASEKSGFPDYSAFIAYFKKSYGITPLKYKKSLNNQK
jgi:AraC-like DNA-binding protein